MRRHARVHPGVSVEFLRLVRPPVYGRVQDIVEVFSTAYKQGGALFQSKPTSVLFMSKSHHNKRKLLILQ